MGVGRGDRLDNHRLDLLSDNRTSRSASSVGVDNSLRRVAVQGRVLGTLLSPAPAQQTSKRNGCKGTENSTGDRTTRHTVVLFDDGLHSLDGGRNRSLNRGRSCSGGTDPGGRSTLNDSRRVRDPSLGTRRDPSTIDHSGGINNASSPRDNSSRATIISGPTKDPGSTRPRSTSSTRPTGG